MAPYLDYFRLFLPCFLEPVTVSGSHSLTGSDGGVGTRFAGFAGFGDDDPGFASSCSARAMDAAISSGETSSPRCMRAAISGVTRTRRTPV